MVWTHGHTGWTGPACQSYTTYLLNKFSNWELKGLKVVSYLALTGADDRVKPHIYVYWVEWDCNESTNTDRPNLLTYVRRYGSQWIDIAKLLLFVFVLDFKLILKIEIWFSLIHKLLTWVVKTTKLVEAGSNSNADQTLAIKPIFGLIKLVPIRWSQQLSLSPTWLSQG